MNRIQVVALIGAVAALVGTLICLVLSVTVWGQSDAYGRLRVPGAGTVRLPQGTVDVAYEAFVPSVGDESPDLPVPEPLDIRVEPANGDGPPATVITSSGATVAINQTVHQRVRRLTVPREGRYRVTVRANTNGATNTALRFGHGGPWRRVLFIGIAAIFACVFVVITAGTRRRVTATAGLALLLLGGCGGGNKTAKTPSADATPKPPPSEQLKYDLLTAAIQLDAYRLQEKTFTDDETKLGAAFPTTVTVKDADADSFYMAARDDKGVRYVLRRTGDVTERTCDPPDQEVCPDGEW